MIVYAPKSDAHALTQSGGGMSLAMEEKILNIENNVIEIKEVFFVFAFCLRRMHVSIHCAMVTRVHARTRTSTRAHTNTQSLS
jgi:hypothetical protein